MEDEVRATAKRRKLKHNMEDIRPPPMSGGLSRPISPPARRNVGRVAKTIDSPFQLTTIQDLPPALNKDAISLNDVLGDPLIAECWEFNYLHDIEFLMNAFDEDVRGLVKVNVVHGFWKSEDQQRQNLEEQASKYKNVTLRTAFMPEMFGTHHSKMLVLLRHDSTAQIIIHTANMIAFDWANMTQAMWRSPLLPLLPKPALPESTQMGRGAKFKVDFLNYLKAYDTKRIICKPLIEQIVKYDFSEIRAALVASVPGKQGIETDSKTLWGWVGLKEVLKSIPVSNEESEVIIQISSIATLGPTSKWLEGTLFKAMSTSRGSLTKPPSFKIIFPTPDEIRRSLNGYASGRAIHTKIQSTQQVKQLAYMKPYFCHWAGDGPQHSSSSSTASVREAGRKRAAPHIKTFVRFADAQKTSIDWMLVTSANLSKQAWGEATNMAGDVRICSYEIGVMVWPELFGDNVKMVPTFKTDSSTPVAAQADVVVGARLPYDLPLVPYGKDDLPWCATSSYAEPDWTGQGYKVE
ncbi:tyrosyl-DNA phosphodiesterase [Phlyctema vagabunda]|uniref:Tyrosyl-DNA phosphodiesterase n=1 Tax=Phlyctema vagabunda TaxID=108571 RepID=A0ABR4P5L8_9HELO